MIERKPAVLVVDDEVGLVDVMEAYLHDEGFGVLRATDGRTAVDIALRERPPTLAANYVFRTLLSILSAKR